jgi:hypothetical protein
LTQNTENFFLHALFDIPTSLDFNNIVFRANFLLIFELAQAILGYSLWLIAKKSQLKNRPLADKATFC